MKNLTKKQIDQSFIENILPAIADQYEQNGRKDKPARCEAYNNYIDSLQKYGQITEAKANVYCIPKRLL